jgi:hypothetical protein
MTMDDDVIARLRQSKYQESPDETRRWEAAEDREAAERRAGRDAGKEWAARRASFHELTSLAHWRSAQGGGILGGRPAMPMSPSDLLRSLALSHQAGHTYATGFIEGALAVWDEVKDKL